MWLYIAIGAAPAAVIALTLLGRSAPDRRPAVGGMTRDEREQAFRRQGYGALLVLDLAAQNRRHDAK